MTKENDQGPLDFSDEISTGSVSEFGYGDPYDPRPQEDNARRRIAYSLIALLFVLVLGILGLVAFGCIQIDEVKELSIVLGPVVALVSAATGFYYGTKTST